LELFTTVFKESFAFPRLSVLCTLPDDEWSSRHMRAMIHTSHLRKKERHCDNLQFGFHIPHFTALHGSHTHLLAKQQRLGFHRNFIVSLSLSLSQKRSLNLWAQRGQFPKPSCSWYLCVFIFPSFLHSSSLFSIIGSQRERHRPPHRLCPKPPPIPSLFYHHAS
jgi:hypothetical protein